MAVSDDQPVSAANLMAILGPGGGFLSSDALRDRVFALLDEYEPPSCTGTASGSHTSGSSVIYRDVEVALGSISFSGSHDGFQASGGGVYFSQAGTYHITANVSYSSNWSNSKRFSSYMTVAGARYQGTEGQGTDDTSVQSVISADVTVSAGQVAKFTFVSDLNRNETVSASARFTISKQTNF